MGWASIQEYDMLLFLDRAICILCGLLFSKLTTTRTIYGSNDHAPSLESKYCAKKEGTMHYMPAY